MYGEEGSLSQDSPIILARRGVVISSANKKPLRVAWSEEELSPAATTNWLWLLMCLKHQGILLKG
jgi:hypothetical protein